MKGWWMMLIGLGACGGGSPAPSADPEPTLPPACGDRSAEDCTTWATGLGEVEDPIQRRTLLLTLTPLCLEFDQLSACQVGAEAWFSGVGARLLQGEDLQGDGSPFGRALKLEEHACSLGDGASCYDRALRHVKGKGVPRGVDLAAPFFASSCAAGWAEGCADHGLLLRQGEAPDEQVAQAYISSCDAGSARGCTLLGLLWRDEPALKQRDAAMGKLSQGCDGGYAPGCGLLAEFYEKEDDAQEQAITAWLAAARLEDPKAYAAVRRLQAEHPESAAFAAGLQSATSACTLGQDGPACFVAGQLHEGAGRGTDAYTLYAAACGAQHRASCGRLVLLAEAGFGDLPPTSSIGVALEAGCSAGQNDVCLRLGKAYEDGTWTGGTDIPRARQVYGMACHDGLDAACDALERLVLRTKEGSPRQ